MKIELTIEKRQNEKGTYFVYYFEYDGKKVYLKPYNYLYTNYLVSEMVEEENDVKKVLREVR